MDRQSSSKRFFELPSGRRIELPSADDERAHTREIRRPEPGEPGARDRTIELGVGDLDEIASSPVVSSPLPELHPSPPALPPDQEAKWSLDGIVEEERPAAEVVSASAPVAAPVKPLRSEPEPARRGFFWRLLFRLGWVKLEEDDYSPLGL